MCQVQRSGLAGAPALVLLGLRAARKDEAGVSAAEAMLPSQLQPPPRAPQAAPEKVDIPSTIRLAKEKEKKREVGIHGFPRLRAGGGGHCTPGCTYPGPYRVLVRERKKLLLEIGATRTWVSVDRLKPHTGAATPAAAQPPPRGRPRKR